VEAGISTRTDSIVIVAVGYSHLYLCLFQNVSKDMVLSIGNLFGLSYQVDFVSNLLLKFLALFLGPSYTMNGCSRIPKACKLQID
jgi:hypothetical protein